MQRQPYHLKKFQWYAAIQMCFRMIFPVFHPAAALHQPSLRADLQKDFQALAQFLETTPRPAAPAPEPPKAKPAEQMTLLG